MKTLFTTLALLLLIGLVCLVQKKIDPRIQKMADELFLHQVKKGFLLHRDSSEFRRKALVKIYDSPYWGNLEKNY